MARCGVHGVRVVAQMPPVPSAVKQMASIVKEGKDAEQQRKEHAAIRSRGGVSIGC